MTPTTVASQPMLRQGLVAAGQIGEMRGRRDPQLTIMAVVTNIAGGLAATG